MLRNLSVHQKIDKPNVLKFLSLPITGVLFLLFMAVAAAENGSDKAADAQDFSIDTVIEYARQLANAPYEASDSAPEALLELDYSTYRQINFQQDAAIWGQSSTQFSVQLFAPGFLYKDLIDIDLIENGKAVPLEITQNTFRVPNEEIGKQLAELGRYAGFRLHYPLNNTEHDDEFIVFQGASYLRIVSKGQKYGLSARGLAINVAQPEGEEFPVFKQFWIERPSPSQQNIFVHALLDSPSVTGAYRFQIEPGSPTKVSVDAILFPREDIEHVGLAPLTSMFMHGGMDRSDHLDFRPAVHDSEGLQMVKGEGETVWRPLMNPQSLQVSAFTDENPQGFGLIQRSRNFDNYQDLEADYHLRPSAWVQLLGDWGKGQVELVEIPSASEENDNIVAYWKPAQGLKKGQSFEFSYILTSPDDMPKEADQPRVVGSASGLKLFDGNKEILIDYSNIAREEIEHIEVIANISEGNILESRIEENPHINSARVFITFDAEGADVAELRVALNKADSQIAPTWLHRWLKQDWYNSQ